MQRNLRRLQFLLLIVLTFGCLSSAVYAVPAIGVTTNNQLVRFDTTNPNSVTLIGTITGLQFNEDILAIDFRPVNGQLYALGSTSRLYTINLFTGAATQVGSAGAFTLSGGSFGFDFNPTVDLIRVVSNTGQNLRLNPTNGTLSGTDIQLNPGSPAVTAAAYTNNTANATSTTLYVIDTNSNTLFVQTPPNNGTLVSVGALGVTGTSNNGFDIAADGTAFAALALGGETRFYRINLTTGAATLVGAIGSGITLRGFAVALPNSQGVGGAKTVLDYDGDRRTDAAVFRTTTNTYFIRRSSNATQIAQPFGIAATDLQVPGDYDGDNITDIAVFRTTNGFFYILQSTTGTIRSEQFGLGTDEPVARDYDGDNRTDLAVVRRENGLLFWFILNSSNRTFRAEQFGIATDVVAPGGQGTFFIRPSAGGGDISRVFGLGSDLVVPGDYDGDGRYDLALVRLGTPFTWLILQSSNNTLRSVQFGAKPQITAQGDYDGDGRTDIATFDPSQGIFYILQSSNNLFTFIRWGSNQDYPVANFDTH